MAAWLGGRAWWAWWTLSYQGAIHGEPVSDTVCRLCLVTRRVTRVEFDCRETEPDFQATALASRRDAATPRIQAGRLQELSIRRVMSEMHDTPGTQEKEKEQEQEQEQEQERRARDGGWNVFQGYGCCSCFFARLDNSASIASRHRACLG
jgi:hypothetical protein